MAKRKKTKRPTTIYRVNIIKNKITMSTEYNTSAGRILVPGGIIHPVVSVSEMIWFMKYIYY
jgi:hypothetical protein